MLIAVLLFSETTVAKLAGRAITPEEVRQVNESDRSLDQHDVGMQDEEITSDELDGLLDDAER